MSRKEFTRAVVESILIKCRRHCALCDRWCGTNIEIHHIDSPDDNSESNALPVCFDCHANIGHYNTSHPKGKKYTTSELGKLRDICFARHDDTLPDLPKGQSDYGRGFHDGFVWAEKIASLKDFWRYISVHGDYGIENLIYFETEDTHSMMDDILHVDNVITSYGTQFENHQSAWSAGIALGLWDLDGNIERIFLTEKGKQFKELVKTNESLNERYNLLREFWGNIHYDKKIKRPSEHSQNFNDNFRPGFLNWFQMETHRTVRINSDRSYLFLIYNVTPDKLELINIENGELTTFKEENIRDAELDHSNGELIIFLK